MTYIIKNRASLMFYQEYMSGVIITLYLNSVILLLIIFAHVEYQDVIRESYQELLARTYHNNQTSKQHQMYPFRVTFVHFHHNWLTQDLV